MSPNDWVAIVPRPLYWTAVGAGCILLSAMGLMGLVVVLHYVRFLWPPVLWRIVCGKETVDREFELTSPWFGLKLAKNTALDRKRDQQIRELERGLESLESRFDRLVTEVARAPITAGGTDDPTYA